MGPRGRRLWAALCERVDGEHGRALLTEACRTADRLDRLDALLVGDESAWFRLRSDASAKMVEVVIDAALAEARQQAMTFQRLIASLPMGVAGDGDADAWLDELPTAVRDA